MPLAASLKVSADSIDASKPSSRSTTARPLRQRAVGGDEERERILHAVEGGRGLHHPAELNAIRKVGRCDQDVGENNRGLRIGCGEGGQLFGSLHDAVPIIDDATEAGRKPRAFRSLAAKQRDLLGILARAHEVEAEVGLEALLLEIQPDQRPADPMRQHGAD